MSEDSINTEPSDIIECNPAIECNSPIECNPYGCINRNFCSSLLFLLPAIYSYSVSYPLVAIGSIICLITSTLHHYYKARHNLFRKIDILCVNSIAVYFVFTCLTLIGFTFYAKIMYLCAMIALIIYFYMYNHPHLYENYYFLVHLFAISGIMFYIKAYDECKNESSANI